jgi:hypothetical protein
MRFPMHAPFTVPVPYNIYSMRVHNGSPLCRALGRISPPMYAAHVGAKALRSTTVRPSPSFLSLAYDNLD